MSKKDALPRRKLSGESLLAAKAIRKPYKYDADYHIPLLIDVFSRGQSIATFCAEAFIVRSTFHQWVIDHPEFGQAYQFANEVSCATWEHEGQRCYLNPGFNATYWSMVMRNRHNYTEHRRITLPALEEATTYTEQQNVIKRALARGDITPQECNQLSAFVMNGARIDELTTMRQELDEVKALVGAGHVA